MKNGTYYSLTRGKIKQIGKEIYQAIKERLI